MPFFPLGVTTGGPYVPYVGATSNVNLGAFSLIAHAVRADASDGLLIEASSGVDVGILGPANTANVSWYGAHNFNASTASTIAWFNSSKTLASLSSVPASLGGTGFTGYAEGDLLYGNGGGTLSKLATQPLPGYVLFSGSTPSWVSLATQAVTSLSGTANQVNVSVNVGSVTLSTPQNIATTSTPQFARLGLGIAAGADDLITGTISVNNASRVYVTNSNVGTGARSGFLAMADVAQGLFDVFSSANTATLFGVSAANAVDFRAVTSNLFSIRTTGAAAPIIFGVNNVEVGRFTSTGLNNTVLGATTAAAASVTTLAASGNITRSGPIATSPAIIVAGTDTTSQALFQVGTGAGAGGNVGARVVLIDASTGGKRWDIASGNTAAGTLTFRNATDGVSSLLLTNTNATLIGTLTTAAPSGGSAQPWNLGEAASVSPTAPNRTIRVSINGTVLYLHAKTTND